MGAAKLSLTGANTFTGGTFINGGTLRVLNDDNLGAASGSLSISNGATLKTFAAITSSRSGAFGVGGAVIDTNGFDSSLTGQFSGSGGLTKAGNGTLMLTGVEYLHGWNVRSTAAFSRFPTTTTWARRHGGIEFQHRRHNDAAPRSRLLQRSPPPGQEFSGAGGATVDTNSFDSILSGQFSGSGGPHQGWRWRADAHRGQFLHRRHIHHWRSPCYFQGQQLGRGEQGTLNISNWRDTKNSSSRSLPPGRECLTLAADD